MEFTDSSEETFFKIEKDVTYCNFDECINKKVFFSEYCHCKTHYPTEEEYNIAYQRNYEYFLEDSYDVNDFSIIETYTDGSCLYNSFVKFLLKYSEDDYFKKHKIFKKIMKSVKPYINNSNYEELLTRNLQELLYSWLIVNLNETIPEMGDISIEEMIITFHSPAISTIEEYKEYYKIYAGDNDFILDENGDSIRIPNRWGSIPEIYAFSQIFDVNVNILNKYKFTKRTMMVTPCTARKINEEHHIFRYKLYNKLNGNSVYNVFLLHTQNHYEYLENK